jgi:hypothetical protein
MGAYNGHATITTSDLRVEVLAYAQSGVEASSGLTWWRGTFSTIDDGGAFALMQVGEAMIELADENDTGRILVSSFDLQMGGAARGSFTGNGALPRSLAA